MSTTFELHGELREDKGKGASRRLRRSGKVPAVLYGGKDKPRAIALDHTELMHQLENEAFYSHILTIKVGDKQQEAILKDLQRHPAKRAVLHADFQRIVADEKLRTNVPLHFLNETTAKGVREGGGVISRLASDVEISCLPKHLPEYIEVDVADLEIDAMLHLSDITLPEGVELVELSYGADHDQPILAINRPRKEEVDTDEGDEPAAAAEGEDKPADPD
ncbi:MAG: 50S ribosomal protein L25/general stress protein Ctc [Pseudomonadota bacterium]